MVSAQEPSPADVTVPTRRYVRIFVAVLGLFVVQAGFDETTFARVVEVLLAGTALVLAAQLEATGARARRVAVAVSVVSLAIAVLQWVLGVRGNGGGVLLIMNGLLVAAGPFLIFKAMRHHRSVSIRTMLGAVTIYMLIGLFFALIYRSMLQFEPTSFSAANGDLDPASMQYFSFVTLTTVGFGDIVAVGSGARTAVALEALIGQIYLVTVVAMVVGNLGRRRERLEY